MGKKKTPKNGVILRYMERIKENPRNKSGDRGYFAAAMMIRNGRKRRNKSSIYITSLYFHIRESF